MVFKKYRIKLNDETHDAKREKGIQFKGRVIKEGSQSKERRYTWIVILLGPYREQTASSNYDNLLNAYFDSIQAPSEKQSNASPWIQEMRRRPPSLLNQGQKKDIKKTMEDVRSQFGGKTITPMCSSKKQELSNMFNPPKTPAVDEKAIYM